MRACVRARRRYSDLVFDAEEAAEENGGDAGDSEDVATWEAARLRCMAQLQQWDKLLENTITSLELPDPADADVSVNHAEVCV